MTRSWQACCRGLIVWSSDRDSLLARCGVLLAFVVIALGAWTRLVDAGLGCPDWPTCYGFMVLPQSAEDTQLANARYPQAPYEVKRAIPEVIHRGFAGLLGLLVLAIVLLRLRAWRAGFSPPPRLAIGLLMLVIVQALFGYLTVSLRLWPQVVVLHLLGGMATLGLLWVLALPRVGGYRAAPLDRYATWGCLGLLVVQIALGGWTSAHYAGLACPDFPTCQHQWWPANDFSAGFQLLQGVGPNYLGGLLDSDARVSIHLAHRLGALAVLLAVGGLALWLWRRVAAPYWMPIALAIALGVQICLGIVSVLTLLPLPLAIAHNLGAAVLLLVLTAVLRYQDSV